MYWNTIDYYTSVLHIVILLQELVVIMCMHVLGFSLTNIISSENRNNFHFLIFNMNVIVSHLCSVSITGTSRKMQIILARDEIPVWFLMEVTCSLLNKHAVYCGFLDLLYQVEQVLFLEFLIFFNIERMLDFYQIIFSMPVEVIFFFFQDL